MGENQPSLLSKIRQLTTDIGIYQHGKLDKPNPAFGYALEDQARALIVAYQLDDRDLEKIYLDFIKRSFRKDGYLNQYFFEDNRGFIEDLTPNTVVDKEEAYGITIWALLSTKHHKREGIVPIINRLEKMSENFGSPRAIASSILGLCTLTENTELELKLTDRLLDCFRKTKTTDWPWFENYLTYANAILPWALWESAIKRNNQESFQTAKIATDFLIDQCQTNGVPCPIGNRGWYRKGGQKELFDQQPIDVSYMICCLEKAYKATSDKTYLDWAKKWWGWFFGNNINKAFMVGKDFSCSDGLSKEGPSKNQGTESNICFVLAYLAAKRLGIIKD